MELLSLAFMQRALVAAVLTGLVAPSIGTYVVQRRLSLLGDGLGHVAIAGVGLALLTNTSPLPVAVVVCVVGAVGIELLRERGKATGDVALAVLFYGGLAAGVLMAGAAGQGAGVLSSYLFGSLTSVTASDLLIVAVLGAIVLLAAIGLAPQLFAVCALWLGWPAVLPFADIPCTIVFSESLLEDSGRITLLAPGVCDDRSSR